MLDFKQYDELSVLAFPREIFEAKANMLVPLVVTPEESYKIQNGNAEEVDMAMKLWLRMAVVGGIAQYSLKNGPAGIYAVFDSFYRGNKVQKYLFTTRVFHGDVPFSISVFVDDVSKAAEFGDDIKREGAFFYHAENGNVRYNSGDFIKFTPCATQALGSLADHDGKLIWTPADQEKTSVELETLLFLG